MTLIFDPKPRLTIGFIQVPGDITLDVEAPPLLSQINDIRWRMTKLSFKNNSEYISTDTYEKSKKNIKKAAATFIPTNNLDYGSIDIMALSCTSMSFAIGPTQVQEELEKGYPNAIATTDMATAIINALHRINASNIGLLTPYIDELHQKNITFLKDNGFNVVKHHNLNLTKDSFISSVNPESILEQAQILFINSKAKLDAIFICCSAFRSTGYGFIDHIEETVGIPVITSNQSLMWECLDKSSKISKEEIKNVKGYGKLFSSQ